MRTISIELIDYSVDTEWWRQVIQLFLKSGCAFGIRCWREEQEIVNKALEYGPLSIPDRTDYEVSVKGTLTAPIIQELLDAKKANHYITSGSRGNTALKVYMYSRLGLL